MKTRHVTPPSLGRKAMLLAVIWAWTAPSVSALITFGSGMRSPSSAVHTIPTLSNTAGASWPLFDACGSHGGIEKENSRS